MEKISIDYDLNKEYITIRVCEYCNGVKYCEKAYDTQEYKEREAALYNDILDTFNLDCRNMSEQFYNMLDNMCEEIIEEINESYEG